MTSALLLISGKYVLFGASALSVIYYLCFRVFPWLYANLFLVLYFLRSPYQCLQLVLLLCAVCTSPHCYWFTLTECKSQADRHFVLFITVLSVASTVPGILLLPDEHLLNKISLDEFLQISNTARVTAHIAFSYSEFFKHQTSWKDPYFFPNPREIQVFKFVWEEGEKKNFNSMRFRVLCWIKTFINPNGLFLKHCGVPILDKMVFHIWKHISFWITVLIRSNCLLDLTILWIPLVWLVLTKT